MEEKEKNDFHIGDDGEIIYHKDDFDDYDDEKPKRKSKDDAFPPPTQPAFSRSTLVVVLGLALVIGGGAMVFLLTPAPQPQFLPGPVMVVTATPLPLNTLDRRVPTGPPLSALPGGGFVLSVPSGSDGFVLTSLSLAELAESPPCAQDPIPWEQSNGRLVLSTLLDDDTELFIMTMDGGKHCRLTNNDANDQAPRWSNDALRLAFISDRDGSPEIYVADPIGTDVVRLTFDDLFQREIVWSADNSQIYFSAGLDVYAMNAEGAEVRLATAAEKTYFDASRFPIGNSFTTFVTQQLQADSWDYR